MAVVHDDVRVEVHALLRRVLNESGISWAWQGVAGSDRRWIGETGSDDLDIWCAASPTEARSLVARLRDQLPGAVVARAEDPRRLRHTSLAVETRHGLAVVDFTFSDLAVGPITLVPVERITVDPIDQRLTGVAAAADLFVRPLLRGRIPEATRMAEARAAWSASSPAQQDLAAKQWCGQLGEVGEAMAAVLDGQSPARDLVQRTRRALIWQTLSLRNLPASLRQWRSIVPAGPSAGPLGLRTRRVVVALVGTDGSGKSTVATELNDRLERAGFSTSTAYFGMAHGNIPGVALARRVLGVEASGDAAGKSVKTGNSDPGENSQVEASKPVDVRSNHPTVRRMGAYFYALEYAWRYLRLVAPSRASRSVVICDRYVYDLRESPWPGSRASRLVESLVPKPDVLVLPDAPAAVIHSRKPERTQAEQAEQQLGFKQLLTERQARVTELIVDTSGETVDAVAPLFLVVVAAAHAAPERTG